MPTYNPNQLPVEPTKEQLRARQEAVPGGSQPNATDEKGNRVYISNPEINPGFKYDNPAFNRAVPTRVDPNATSGTQGAIDNGFTSPTFNTLAEYQSYLQGDEASKKAIADRYEQELKAVTDNINATYEQIRGKQTQVNKNQEGRDRALISAGQYGGVGGGGAVSESNKTSKEGADALAVIESTRLAKLNDARTAIFNKQSAEQDKGRSQRQAEYSNFETIQKNQLDTALKSIKSFAEGKGDLSKLKEQNPEWYNKYLSAFGGSDLALDAYMESQKPAEDKIKYTEKIYKGENGNAFVYRYGFDPATGKLKSFDEDTGANYADFAGKIGTTKVEFKTSGDGQLYAISTTPDEDGNFKSVKIGGVKPVKAVTPASAKPMKSGSLTYTGEDLAEGSQLLDTSRKTGTDGYANSGIYVDMYKAWIKNGGLIQDFLKEYPPIKYINPSDASVPVYLRAKATGALNVISNGNF